MMPAWFIKFAIAPKLCMDIAMGCNVDPYLVIAMIQAESRGGHLPTKFEPPYRYLWHPKQFAKELGITEDTEIIEQKTSWGPMHLMGGTARWMGFREPLPHLTRPAVGIRWGCRYLQRQFDKYGDTEKALAAYNGGSPRYDKDNPERFENQYYVDRVLAFYDDLTK